MSFHAIGTGAAKNHFTAFHKQSIFLSHLLANPGSNKFPRNINDCTALCADKMRMRPYIAVEAFLAVYHANAIDNPIAFELRNVAIDRSQTQVGILGFQLLIDPFRCGMNFGVANGHQNCFPLPAKVLSFLH